MEKAEPFAFGHLGLKPWEFEQMTMGEYLAMGEAYNERLRYEDRRMAYYIAWTLTPYSDDLANTYKTIYYGLHPNERPSSEEEKQAFCEIFNV